MTTNELEKRLPSIWDVFRDLDYDRNWPSGRLLGQSSGAYIPAIDVIESKDSYKVNAELPGFKKDDIHVSINAGVLSINAENKSSHEEKEDGRVVRQERRYGQYIRSVQLGNDVDDSNIDAQYKDGILTLVLPKKEEARPKKIEVNIG